MLCSPGSPGIFFLNSSTAVRSSPSHPVNRLQDTSPRRLGTEVPPTTWSFRLASCYMITYCGCVRSVLVSPMAFVISVFLQSGHRACHTQPRLHIPLSLPSTTW